eukprot:1586159-Rhodomonas_salina.2
MSGADATLCQAQNRQDGGNRWRVKTRVGVGERGLNLSKEIPLHAVLVASILLSAARPRSEPGT